MSRSPRVHAHTGAITQLTAKGTGRVESIHGPIYVPYTVPGDRITAQIIKSTPNYSIGKLTQLLEKSHDRRTPACRYYGRCGGCQLMHISTEAQQKFKTEWLTQRIAHPLQPLITGQEYNVRNRIQLSVIDRGRNLKLGLNRVHSHTINPLSECPMTHPAISNLVPVITTWLQYTQCEWIQVTIRAGTSLENDPNCIVVLKGTPSPNDQAYISQTWQTLPISGVVIVSEATVVEWGRPVVFQVINGIKHQVSWGAFFQGNSPLTPVLLETVIGLTSPHAAERGLDLFGGLGLFGIHLGKQSLSVTILDTNPQSIGDATATINAHELHHVKAMVSDANAIHTELSHCDYVVVDPPRTGLGAALKRRLNHDGPARLIYVSCNPDTFVRDLVDLSAYRCTIIQPIDMFPNTVHLELVARFERIST